MMFDMGFLPDVRRIIAALPAPRQTLLFSATMPSEIRGLANDFLQRPISVEINAEQPLETISHAIFPVDEQQKLGMLLALLPQAGKGQVLIFTRTKHRAKKLAEKLVTSGFSATSLQGNLSQNRRQEAMDNFRSGRVQVMVATDIAARGIDVTQVTHVINFDLPDTAEAYTHRTGRTGRMERLGTAFSLITRDDTTMVRMIERVLGQPLERRKLEGFAMSAEPAVSSAELFQRGPRQPNGRSGGRPGSRPGQQNQRPAQAPNAAYRGEPARQQPTAPPLPNAANRPGEQPQRPGENERPRRPFNARRQWDRA
jgi:ATP-dependent RNA helicase RhlE